MKKSIEKKSEQNKTSRDRSLFETDTTYNAVVAIGKLAMWSWINREEKLRRSWRTKFDEDEATDVVQE